MFHSGNPAVIGDPLDRWLCDPFFRRVCLCRCAIRVGYGIAHVNASRCSDLKSTLCNDAQQPKSRTPAISIRRVFCFHSIFSDSEIWKDCTVKLDPDVVKCKSSACRRSLQRPTDRSWAGSCRSRPRIRSHARGRREEITMSNTCKKLFDARKHFGLLFTGQFVGLLGLITPTELPLSKGILKRARTAMSTPTLNQTLKYMEKAASTASHTISP
jgi:hypothetical protein